MIGWGFLVLLDVCACVRACVRCLLWLPYILHSVQAIMLAIAMWTPKINPSSSNFPALTHAHAHRFLPRPEEDQRHVGLL